MAAWTHSKVLSDIQLEVSTNKSTYNFKENVVLNVKLTNTGQDQFDLDGRELDRSVYILVMEKQGTGTFSMSLKFLFGQVNRLQIAPGDSISTSTTLNFAALSDKTQINHYEFPERIRTFQVFLPLSLEIPSGFDNMIQSSADEITVADSWTSDPDLRFPRFIYWIVKFLRRLFNARP